MPTKQPTRGKLRGSSLYGCIYSPNQMNREYRPQPREVIERKHAIMRERVLSSLKRTDTR